MIGRLIKNLVSCEYPRWQSGDDSGKPTKIRALRFLNTPTGSWRIVQVQPASGLSPIAWSAKLDGKFNLNKYPNSRWGYSQASPFAAVRLNVNHPPIAIGGMCA